MGVGSCRGGVTLLYTDQAYYLVIEINNSAKDWIAEGIYKDLNNTDKHI